MDNYQSTCNICKIIKEIFNKVRNDISPRHHNIGPISPAPYKRDESLIQRGLPYRK